jgi:hypothetical protein
MKASVDESASPLLSKSPSIHSLKGFVPFQSDPRDKDYVMSQGDFLRMSLSSAASPLRSPRQSSVFGQHPKASADSLKFSSPYLNAKDA